MVTARASDRNTFATFRGKLEQYAEFRSPRYGGAGRPEVGYRWVGRESG